MKSELIDQRQQKQKELLIEQLKKMPIIQVACEKLGVGRATYYRWLKSDERFKEASNQASMEGRLLINDLAESKLISALNDGDLRAVQWWLRHNHEIYSNKVEVTTKENSKKKLSKEDMKTIKSALKRSGILKNKTKNDDQK